MAAILMT
jgi:hypothetical protein